MPEPRIEQAHQRVRRKIALACQACRERKTRCDGAMPMCGGCRRRRYTQDLCVYASIENARSSSEKEYIRLLHERIRTLESRNPGPESLYSNVSTASPAIDVNSTSLDGGNVPCNIARLLSPASPEPRQAFNVAVSPQDQNDATTSDSRNIPDSTNSVYQQAQPKRSFAATPVPTPNAAVEPFHSANDRLVLAAHDQLKPAYSSEFRFDNEAPEPPPRGAPIAAFPSTGRATQVSDHDSPINAMGTALALPNETPSPSEKFYGMSSAVSFLCQIRDTVNQHSGKSEPVQHNTSSQRPRQPFHPLYNLSNDATGSQLEQYSLPPRELTEELLGCYWRRVHCLYPFVHKATFMSAYAQLWLAEPDGRHILMDADPGLGGSNCSSSVFYCALNSMLALGCQFSDMEIEKRENLATSLFRRSMDLLHVNILDEGTLALLQTLLIVAQYLQSTQLPNRCWNIVGLAVRVAQGLGLYSDTATHTVHSRHFLETEMRRRAWHGCITLDMVVSMTLGRPAIINPESTVPLPLPIDDEYMDQETITHPQPLGVFSRTTFFVETIKLYNILGTVLMKVYKPWNEIENCERKDGDISHHSSTLTIIELDSAMNELEAKLPWELRWNRPSYISGAAAEVFERQTNVLHARFLHLRILLYRPTLNRLCRSFHLGSSQGTDVTATAQRALGDSLDGHSSEFADFCSMTCIEAAQDLIKLINQSSQTRVTGAWWYNVFYLSTSAMVLLLAEIWKPSTKMLSQSSLLISWQQCLDALARIASSNNAANGCAKVLVAMRQRIRSNNGSHGLRVDELMDPKGGLQPDIETSASWMDFDLQPDIDIADILCRDPGLLPPWNLEDIGLWQLPNSNASSY